MHVGGPVRTCIGCRTPVSATELLRVVVAGQSAVAQTSSATPVVPDPRRRARGRGAWVHPVLACVDLAERRRAFARALRVPGPVDPSAVRDFIKLLVDRPQSTSMIDQHHRWTHRPDATPQE